jgi:hypothetical protein
MTPIRPYIALNLLLIVSISIIGCKGQSGSETEVSKLVTAIGESDTATIRALVKKGINLDESFHPALNFYIAIELNDMYTLTELASRMDACGISVKNESPVVRAVRQDKVEMVNLLGICSHSNHGSILNFATSREMYALLRKLGATPDSETPFHLVDVDLPIELRRMFATNECTQYSKNAGGTTLIDYAKSKNAKRILESIDIFYNTADDNGK